MVTGGKELEKTWPAARLSSLKELTRKTRHFLSACRWDMLPWLLQTLDFKVSVCLPDLSRSLPLLHTPCSPATAPHHCSLNLCLSLHWAHLAFCLVSLHYANWNLSWSTMCCPPDVLSCSPAHPLLCISPVRIHSLESHFLEPLLGHRNLGIFVKKNDLKYRGDQVEDISSMSYGSFV